jgi:uncharacterized protein
MLMSRDEVVKIIRAHWSDLERLGIRHLFLFGSVARDSAHADSDVDCLAEFAAPPGFANFMDAKLLLEDLLARPVDLATPASLKPRLRAAIQRELYRVA